ncbi:hypothetical protein JL09_g6687 [Pichia kudriavzevii]|uniref:Uncharacterized protein n=1 Tax=Pichia kudriavzevii TaxID=4909 RepID=A0A099NL80_PICKU|nr:hypothetical protein JL09_g6687 [Pichia kudriavzevii]
MSQGPIPADITEGEDRPSSGALEISPREP